MRVQLDESDPRPGRLIVEGHEWFDFCSLCQFGKAVMEYDRARHYALQVLDYRGFEPVDFINSQDLGLAFDAVHAAAERYRETGVVPVVVTVAVSPLCSLLEFLGSVVGSRDRAMLHYDPNRNDGLPPFPDLHNSATDYETAFFRLSLAVESGKALSIPTGPGKQSTG